MTRLDEDLMAPVDTEDETADAELAEHFAGEDIAASRDDSLARGIRNPAGDIIAVEIGRPGSQNVLTIRETRRLYFGDLAAILAEAPHDDPVLPPEGEQLGLG
jgi:hypothetical protein